MSERRWEHYPHEADIGVRGIGPSPDEAFAQAAVALTAVMTDPDLVTPAHVVEIVCQAPDLELLFVDWLNALVYETATCRMLFSRFVVRIEGGQLRAQAWGERIDPARHHPAVEVKGATYTDLLVRQKPDGEWLAQCVVDV